LNIAKRAFSKNAAKCFDLTVLSGCFLFVLLALHSNLRPKSVQQYLAYSVPVARVIQFIFLLLAWHTIFSACGLYVSKRLSTRWSEVLEVVKATTLASLVLFIFAPVLHVEMTRTWFAAVFWILSTASVALGRVFVRWMQGVLRSHGRNSRIMLILGTNARAIDFAKRIQSKSTLGYQIRGFVDDYWPGMSEFEQSGYTLCSSFAGMAEFLRVNVVDEVAIFVPLRSFYENASKVATLCEQHGILLRFDTQIFDLKIAHSRAEDLDGEPQITAGTGASQGWGFFFKRLLDFWLSLALIVAISPLLIVIAILIKATSSGPVLFRQNRVGLNKRHFVMYKFRSMVPNAEALQELLLPQNEMNGPVFKIRNDPRVTSIGRVLRKTSLDELPQLFNVLKGDMSLVGPRAMSLRDYQHFDQDWQRRRFSVRPGITCLWQVNGRNSIPFEKWMELDMQYIDKWSIWLDLKILVQTIPAVVRGVGAA
jgi:exopolysaccharide biosynthesis polyprenyl glycosylphosphotransferase